jgi:hypothetical protein
MSHAREAAFELAADSFFVGGGEQQELFDQAADLFCKEAVRLETDAGISLTRNPTFTADTLAKHSPEKFNLVAWMIAQDMPVRECARVAHVSPNTVMAIRRKIEQTGQVDTVRQLLADDARSLARLTLERIKEILLTRNQDDLDEGKLANLLKHLVEKSELLAGNATERVEWKPTKPEPSAYEQFIAGALDVTPDEMRPAVEKSDAHAGRLAAGAVTEDEPERAAGPGGEMQGEGL